MTTQRGIDHKRVRRVHLDHLRIPEGRVGSASYEGQMNILELEVDLASTETMLIGC
jgi:hypothetical protein